MQLHELTIFIIKSLFVIIVVLSLLIGVVWPLIRNLTDSSDRRSIESQAQSHRRSAPLFPVDEEEVEIPTTGKSEEEQQKEILKMARDDQSKTALLIRNWSNEKK